MQLLIIFNWSGRIKKFSPLLVLHLELVWLFVYAEEFRCQWLRILIMADGMPELNSLILA